MDMFYSDGTKVHGGDTVTLKQARSVTGTVFEVDAAEECAWVEFEGARPDDWVDVSDLILVRRGW